MIFSYLWTDDDKDVSNFDKAKPTIVWFKDHLPIDIYEDKRYNASISGETEYFLNSFKLT